MFLYSASGACRRQNCQLAFVEDLCAPLLSKHSCNRSTLKYDPLSVSAKFCLLFTSIFSLALFQAFRFLHPVKETQNSFATIRQILDVFFIRYL